MKLTLPCALSPHKANKSDQSMAYLEFTPNPFPEEQNR